MNNKAKVFIKLPIEAQPALLQKGGINAGRQAH
jgi:hypothetical protein